MNRAKLLQHFDHVVKIAKRRGRRFPHKQLADRRVIAE
jgi:hypothetical protein